MKKNRKFPARDMAYIGVGAVFITLCSWIAIPAPVPFTLQTFAVFFVLGFLGGRRGFFSVAVYLLMGLVGVPVFSGFTGGLGALLGATGGYIIGFILSAVLYRLITALWGDGLGFRLVAMFSGLGLCYGFGTLWYVFVFASGSGGGIASALSLCVVPFIIPDVVKIVCAALLSVAVERRISKRRY